MFYTLYNRKNFIFFEKIMFYRSIIPTFVLIIRKRKNMVLNYIWVGLFFVAMIVAIIKLIFFGDINVFTNIINATFSSSKTAFEISIGLTGVLSLWLGIMKIGEKSGLINVLSRWLNPVFSKLFPDIPKGHPASGSIFMNLAANMMGLDNAATPLGLKAMEELQSINPKKDTASNPMIMFLVLNTSGLVIIPVSIMVYRAQQGAAQPMDVFLPILISTISAAMIGVVVTSIYQRINLFNRTIMLFFGGIVVFLGGMIFLFSKANKAYINTYSTLVANIFLFSVIILFILNGFRKKINVYDAFVEGAKDGFSTAVRIIPYLVAILVAVGVFRASGAMDLLIKGITVGLQACHINTDFVGALPTMLMKPLSGSGSRGLMVDAMATYGADSFVGRLACVMQGSTDTTFYILAVYFGSVGITKTRHAVTCGLIADFAGSLIAIPLCYLFFGH